MGEVMFFWSASDIVDKDYGFKYHLCCSGSVDDEMKLFLELQPSVIAKVFHFIFILRKLDPYNRSQYCYAGLQLFF